MAMDKFVCEFMLLMTLSIEQSVNMWAAVASYVQRLRVAGAYVLLAPERMSCRHDRITHAMSALHTVG